MHVHKNIPTLTPKPICLPRICSQIFPLVRCTAWVGAPAWVGGRGGRRSGWEGFVCHGNMYISIHIYIYIFTNVYRYLYVWSIAETLHRQQDLLKRKRAPPSCTRTPRSPGKSGPGCRESARQRPHGRCFCTSSGFAGFRGCNCLCIYIYMYTCAYIDIYIYIFFLFVYVFIYFFIFIYSFMYIYIYVEMDTSIYIYI